MALSVDRIWQHCQHSVASPPYGPKLAKKQAKVSVKDLGIRIDKIKQNKCYRGEGLHRYDDYIAVEFRL